MSAETKATFDIAQRELRAQAAVSSGTPPSRNIRGGLGMGYKSDDRRGGAFVPSGKIKLVEEINLYVGSNLNAKHDGPAHRNASVLFEVQPELSESKSTNYVEIGEIRSSASLLIFMGSPSRNFSLNAKLVSRTEEEATQNFEYLHRLKGWSMPDPKYQTKISGHGVPRTLLLYAYGKNIKGIPTVIKTLNIDYPVDCDYIITQDKDARMPIILNISIQLQETRTPDELTAFNIEQYKTGQLPWW